MRIHLEESSYYLVTIVAEIGRAWQCIDNNIFELY